jgi:casein kinase II subunit beta
MIFYELITFVRINYIYRFCGLKGHEMFCEVERSYIEDGFNLYGLRVCVSNFSDCLDLILDRIGPDEESDDSHITQSACTLYGLIHARYIITAHGLDAMYNKVRKSLLLITVICTREGCFGLF